MAAEDAASRGDRIDDLTRAFGIDPAKVERIEIFASEITFHTFEMRDDPVFGRRSIKGAFNMRVRAFRDTP